MESTWHGILHVAVNTVYSIDILPSSHPWSMICYQFVFTRQSDNVEKFKHEEQAAFGHLKNDMQILKQTWQSYGELVSLARRTSILQIFLLYTCYTI